MNEIFIFRENIKLNCFKEKRNMKKTSKLRKVS